VSHIVLLTPTFNGHDGLSCLSRQLHEALAAAQSGPVTVMSLAGESSRTDPTNVHLYGGDRLRFGRHSVQMAARVSPPSLVVVAHMHLLSLAWPAALRGVSVLPVLVGIDAWQPLTRARVRTMRRAPRAVSISRHTATRFRRANPAFSALPIDVCWPATPPLTVPDLSQPLPESPYALIVGRLAGEERYKGHDVLIDVWASVRSQVPEARLVVAGSGDDEWRLRARAKASGVSDAILFEGLVAPGRLSALYANCAFFVLPSAHEGFGFVFLEAMSAGRACIGSRGSAEEIIEPAVTGLIVDASNHHEVSEALVRLLRDVEGCERMGEAGRRRAADIFSIERFGRDLQRALNEVVPNAMAPAW